MDRRKFFKGLQQSFQLAISGYIFTHTPSAFAVFNMSMMKKRATGGGGGAVAIFSGGFDGSWTAVSDKYTYSGDSVVAGTSLLATRNNMGSAGNTTAGILAGGQNIFALATCN